MKAGAQPPATPPAPLAATTAAPFSPREGGTPLPGGSYDPYGLLAAEGLAAGPGDDPAAAAALAQTLLGEAAAAAAAAAEAAAASSTTGLRGESPREVCVQCGGRMRRDLSDLDWSCDDCGLRVEGDTAEAEDDGLHAAPSVARLRVVGPGSSQLQPDLYRSGVGSTPASQQKQVFEEYLTCRQRFIEAGGRAFPQDACLRAAEHYNAVQRLCVKRSQNKLSIMAACLYQGCLDIGFAPSKSVIADFMQLPHRGIARGENFVRTLVADGKMDLDLCADSGRAEVTTLFAHLGLEAERFAPLREAVLDVVGTAVRHNIGTSSILRSKVAGATYVVLRRCRDRGLIPKPPALQEVCQNHMRKHTLERFARELADYHSFFEPCYLKAGLDSAAPAPGQALAAAR